ncbi:hypothetical protein B0A49_03963 [Cryomyces minteri]|uniref:Aquaporin n=1 Tax=Cryomyces minteri TaxID=331657 RepID=A0A4U0XKV7_9PEZI|nr:hypothetical protein B0A49_03963 [Cryomyces minteri]
MREGKEGRKTEERNWWANIADRCAEFPPNNSKWRKSAKHAMAELIASFVVVLLGICNNLQIHVMNLETTYKGDLTLDSGNHTFSLGSENQTGLELAQAWGWGLAVMIGMLLTGGISEAHINPVASVMLWISRRTDKFHSFWVLLWYIVAQIIGAIAGGLVAVGIWKRPLKHHGHYKHDKSGASVYAVPQECQSAPGAFFNEFSASAILLGSIFAIVDTIRKHPDFEPVAPLMIGLVSVCLSLAMGYTTGGSLNVARDLGARIAMTALWEHDSSAWNKFYCWSVWGPWVAVPSGAIVGGLVYEVCLFTGFNRVERIDCLQQPQAGNDASSNMERGTTGRAVAAQGNESKATNRPDDERTLVEKSARNTRSECGPANDHGQDFEEANETGPDIISRETNRGGASLCISGGDGDAAGIATTVESGEHIALENMRNSS